MSCKQKPKRQYVRKKPKPEKLPTSSLAIPDAVHQPQPSTSTNSGVLSLEGKHSMVKVLFIYMYEPRGERVN